MNKSEVVKYRKVNKLFEFLLNSLNQGYNKNIVFSDDDIKLCKDSTCIFEVLNSFMAIHVANGTYNEENKTITWTEKVTGIDTYANGEKEIEVTKTIKVVYVDMDVTAGSFVNKAEGTLKLDEINKEVPTDPAEKETEQNFKKDVTVIKVWTGDEEVAENVRPSDITINLDHNQTTTMTSSNAVEGKAIKTVTKKN